MLDDLFLENNDTSYSVSNDNKISKDNPSSINCASYLEKPELPLNESNFVGLFNQGGTCYMNSALQVLYMNPLFRQIIYNLPLCENDNISIPSNFVEQGQMYDILLAIQKLFIQLDKYNIRAISTKSLTEAFSWSGNDGSVQHDSQEFIRLILETLYGILLTTSFNGVIYNLFRVVTFSYRTCSNCNHTKTSEEFNIEITVPVRDKTGLLDSLNTLYNSFEIINDYKCDECNTRVDLKRGNKICELPPLLNFSLNKMDYDQNTYERIKLHSRFDFPLEIDMKSYVKEDMINNKENTDEEFKYELYSIIIHTGTPYQGHYFSYIRDLNEEGVWNLSMNKEFRSEPEKTEEQKEEIKKEEKEGINLIDVVNEPEEEHQEKENNKNKGQKLNKKNNGNNGNNNKKGKSKNKKGDIEKEYEKINFDECDHPLSYSNKKLTRGWFDFNDTSIMPIRIGRIQKQFQSSESAYILFYMKKSVCIEKTIAPVYLQKCNLIYLIFLDVQDLNSDIAIQRSLYEDELNSLNITIFEESNFYIDQNNILTIKSEISDLEKSNYQFDLKLKFYNTFDHVLSEIKEYYLSQKNKSLDTDNLILYEIMYRKDNNTLTVITKYDSLNKSEDLDKLKICHKSRFILVSLNNKTELLNTLVIDRQVGVNFEPVSIHIIYGTEDKFIRVFANTDILNFKQLIKDYFKIEQSNITLIFKNNNKSINLEQIGYDKKNECWLTLKQLKVLDKSIIFITKSIVENDNENKNEDYSSFIPKEDKINCIVKIEDEEEVTLIKSKLNKTFEDLIDKIKFKFKLVTHNNTERGVDNDDIINETIRLRKELDGRIIYKNQYKMKLDSDEMFIEGGVRLRIEFGEPYETNEILLKINLNINNKKECKEFIGDPEKTLISDLKKLICEQFNYRPEEYMFYKTSALGDPNKAIKNENQVINKIGLKDSDTIFLKNISAELYETYLLKIHNYSNINELNDTEFIFRPISDSSFNLELNLPKDTTLKSLKEMIVNSLNLNEKVKDINMLRVRLVGKKLDPERILRGNETSLKKLNIENPCTLLIEILHQEETLKDNQIQLYIWTRNIKEKSYLNKITRIFEFMNNLASSDQLYELCRKETGFKNISIAKYAKFNYAWETIPEMNEDGPINLRKVYNLRDGDWIGVRNDDENYDLKDDFQTKEDKKTLNMIKSMKIESGKENDKRSNKHIEKPLRIPKFNNN